MLSVALIFTWFLVFGFLGYLRMALESLGWGIDVLAVGNVLFIAVPALVMFGPLGYFLWRWRDLGKPSLAKVAFIVAGAYLFPLFLPVDPKAYLGIALVGAALLALWRFARTAPEEEGQAQRLRWGTVFGWLLGLAATIAHEYFVREMRFELFS
jgi:hypothetical protein